MRTLKLAGAALNQTPIDWQSNLNHILEAIEKAKQDSVDILCLPELCITGYGCEDLFLSDWLSEKAIEQLLKIIPHTKNIAVSVGLPYRLNGKTFNSACFIHNQEILGFNIKQNLANDGIHYEPRWFTPGTPEEFINIEINGKKYLFGDLTYEIKGVKVGFEICEDAWSGKKRPACKLQEKGIELILNGSASHFSIQKSKERKELFRKSSEEFNCTYLYVNPLGNESGKIIFDGEIILSQNGKYLKTNSLCSLNSIDYISKEVHFDDKNKNLIEAPTEEEPFVEFTKAATLGLFDYLRKSRSKGFVLSLSGGADSSACAILVAEMVKRGVNELGVKNFVEKLQIETISKLKLNSSDIEKKIVFELLKTAYQATINSSESTFLSAKSLAESIGADFKYWEIDSQIEAYTTQVETALGRQLSWAEDDLSLQNIQARARSPIIWMLANIHNALLLTTSNRSEGDVGYATMDGDTSGSIAPIASIDKHFLLKWLQWAEKELGYSGLRLVNELNPSAELRPKERDQKDEDDLMPYHIIVEIEKLAIRERLSPIQVFQELAEKKLESEELLKEHIKKFFRLWSRNQWKRERIAPSFHLDDFSVDPKTWCRFPILSGGFDEELNNL